MHPNRNPKSKIDPPLLKKLGVKEGQRILALGFPDRDFLEHFPSKTQFDRDEVFDLILLHANTWDELQRLETLEPLLSEKGAVWTVTPKGPTGLNGTGVIMYCRSIGLNDTKICSFSETHTGRRFIRYK